MLEIDFTFHLSTRIHFGLGRLKKAGKIAKIYGRKAFLVTGKSSAKKLGFLQTLKEALEGEGVEYTTFDKVEPNPSIQTVEAASRLFKERSCDHIIALGGGSPLDAAKIMGLLVSSPPPLSQYFGKDKIEKSIPPLVAIPTTAGTGSEVTPYAVITEIKNSEHTKRVIASPYLCPEEAILDPELTLPLPVSLTSDTGVDALSHAIESYISKKASFLSEAIALEAVKLIGQYLPVAVKSPQDIEARSHMMYASLLAGVAITQTGATLLHGMGYRLTSDFGIPHGKANGVLLPAFWEINFPGCPEKFSRLIPYLEENAPLSSRQDPERSAHMIKNFLHRAGLTEEPKLNINEDTILEFAREAAENKRRMANNPRNLSLEEITTIYKKSLGR